MRIEKVSDLLPIPESVTKPHAYQVFGLEGGEQDVGKVVTAIQNVYQRLKATKAQSDPKVWKQAAGLAEAARKVLTDPELRRELDAQFGVVRGDAESESDMGKTADQNMGTPGEQTAPAEDPLAAVLPSSNPLSATSLDSSKAGNVLGMPPLGNPSASALGTPPLGAPPAAPTPTALEASAVPTAATGATQPDTSPQTAEINLAPVKPVRRRKRKKHGTTLVLGGFVVVLLGSLGYLLYFLSSGNRITIGEQSIAAANPGAGAANAPGASVPKGQRDGVMDQVPASGIAESIRERDHNRPSKGSGLASSDPTRNPNLGPPSTQLPKPSTQPPKPGTQPPEMTSGMENSDTDPGGMNDAMDAPSSDDASPEPAPAPSTPTAGEPETKPPGTDEMDSIPETQPNASEPSQPTPQELAENENKLEAVEKLILAADWDQMKAAADALEKRSLSEAQRTRARSLYDIADLASFYRGAIERGLGTLKTGNTFDYEGIQVIVVQVDSQSLTFQFNRRQKSFSIDEMPPRLTETIAAFQLSKERPDTIAGLALYRLIRSSTNQAYREQAFRSLESVDGQLENVDTKSLIQVAKDLFSN
jgi:hypothetical protein